MIRMVSMFLHLWFRGPAPPGLYVSMTCRSRMLPAIPHNLAARYRLCVPLQFDEGLEGLREVQRLFRVDVDDHHRQGNEGEPLLVALAVLAEHFPGLAVLGVVKFPDQPVEVTDRLSAQFFRFVLFRKEVVIVAADMAQEIPARPALVQDASHQAG